jgi:dinuclear metal center YbgI/SA1388 family protein
MQLNEVMTILDSIAPFDSAEEWDNVGLMVGDLGKEINSVLVALDPSLEVIGKAISSCTDLILTHHPLMIQPIKCFDLGEMVVKKIALLMESKINLVSMHTNLDKAPGGVADELALRIGLIGTRSLGALRVGSIETPSSLKPWLKALAVKEARFIDAGRVVHKVGACPGSGMEYWRLALQEGCDTIVTGDVRYHAAADALAAGLNVVDLGHFCTEELIIKPLAERLRKKLNGIDVRAFQADDIFSFYHN